MAMQADSKRRDSRKIAADLRAFLREFTFYAGRRGVLTLSLVALGAIVEGVSLVLIIPLLAIVIGTGLPAGRLDHAVNALFEFVQLERPLTRLTFLLVLFGQIGRAHV